MDITQQVVYSHALIRELRGGGQLLSRLPAVSDGAPIRTGARVHTELSLMHRSEQQILACEEALLAACEFAGPGSRRYPWSVYAVARACLEGAATIHWTLSPEASDTRLGRLCLLEIDDLNYEIAHTKAWTGTPNADRLKQLKTRKTELMRSAAHLRVMSKVGSKGPRSVTERLREFDLLAGPESNYLQTWRLCCAAIHGSKWGIQAVTKIMPETNDGIVAMVQHQDLADMTVVIAATALRSAHRAYGALSGNDLSLRIPAPGDLVFRNTIEAAA